MSIKRWIARKLYPQAFEDAERYRYLFSRVDDLEQWCFGHVPQASAAASWLKASVRTHFMSSGEYLSTVRSGRHDEISEGISEFREKLKAMKPRQVA